ncbi:MAG: hypothetical protein ACLVHY_03670 [Gemmiger sp.]
MLILLLPAQPVLADVLGGLAGLINMRRAIPQIPCPPWPRWPPSCNVSCFGKAGMV